MAHNRTRKKSRDEIADRQGFIALLTVLSVAGIVCFLMGQVGIGVILLGIVASVLVAVLPARSNTEAAHRTQDEERKLALGDPEA
jgi:cobalamin biosynthesis protein CobD/CbiB